MTSEDEEDRQFERAVEMVEGLAGLMRAAGIDPETIAAALVGGAAEVARVAMTDESFARIVLETLKAYEATNPTEQ